MKPQKDPPPMPCPFIIHGIFPRFPKITFSPPILYHPRYVCTNSCSPHTTRPSISPAQAPHIPSTSQNPRNVTLRSPPPPCVCISTRSSSSSSLISLSQVHGEQKFGHVLVQNWERKMQCRLFEGLRGFEERWSSNVSLFWCSENFFFVCLIVTLVLPLVEDVVMIILVLIWFSGRSGVGVLRFTVGVCN